MSSANFKLGRLARAFNPRVPHYSALIAGKSLPAIPASHDWSRDMKPIPGSPTPFGMMDNDTLGDCTCAAVYHARQLWTSNYGNMITEPDSDVELLYEKACGWNPAVPGEGPGGNEQAVLTYLTNIGAPTGPAGATVDKISAFVEVDPRNIADVKRTIYSCGLAYIGFQVPQSVMPAGGPPPAVWRVDPGDSKIIGGHAVVLVGYNSEYAKLISWGQFYEMTWQFFSTFVDETYAIADDAWFNSQNASNPLGLTLQQLEAQMQALKGN